VCREVVMKRCGLLIESAALVVLLCCGCDSEKTQERLDANRKWSEQQLRYNRTIRPELRDVEQELYRALTSTTVKALERPEVVYARLGISNKRVVLLIDWIAKRPIVDSVRVEAKNGKYMKVFPLEKVDREGLLKEAKFSVAYMVGIFFEKGDKEVQNIINSLRAGDVTASLMYNGKTVSNGKSIRFCDWRRTTTTWGVPCPTTKARP
jgi:hypothetical protein